MCVRVVQWIRTPPPKNLHAENPIFPSGSFAALALLRAEAVARGHAGWRAFVCAEHARARISVAPLLGRSAARRRSPNAAASVCFQPPFRTGPSSHRVRCASASVCVFVCVHRPVPTRNSPRSRPCTNNTNEEKNTTHTRHDSRYSAHHYMRRFLRDQLACAFVCSWKRPQVHKRDSRVRACVTFG